MSLREVKSVRAVWAEGRRGEDQRCPKAGSVCLSRGWQGLSSPGELPATLKTHTWNAVAWHSAGGSAGLGMGVGKAGTGGRRKKTANEQQRKTQVKLDVG